MPYPCMYTAHDIAKSCHFVTLLEIRAKNKEYAVTSWFLSYHWQ